MSNSKVSVIIPSYNAARTVEAALDSVLAQTLLPDQIIVVDDGSKDDTEVVVGRYASRGVLYVRQQNQGVSVARNCGLRHASSDYIAFLDADDAWHPRKLEFQHAIMAVLPHLGALGTHTFGWPGSLPDVPAAPDQALVQDVAWADLAVKNLFTTSSVLVRRSVLDEIGADPFDVSLRGPEDHDLWLRLAERSAVANLALPMTGYRTTPGSLGRQVATMREGTARILLKLDARGVWKGAGRPFLRRKAYGYFHYISAYMSGASGNQRIAIAELLRSLIAYPLPFASGELTCSFARLRLLATAVLRMARLKAKHDPGCI